MTAFTTMRRALLVGVLATLGVTAPAFAQDVSWTDPGPLGAGQRATLDLVFDETEPRGAVRLPAIDGLSVLGTPSQSSQVAIVNGQRSASSTLSYTVRAEREGRIEIPTFEVTATDGTHTVSALSIEVGPATLLGKEQRDATPVGDAVTARMVPSTKQPYAGQVFNLAVVVGLRDGRHGEVVGAPEWDKPGVEAESWGKGQQSSMASGSTVRFRTRAVVPKSGAITLPPAQQEVRIDSGRSGDPDDFFSMPNFAMPKLSMRGFSMPDLGDFFPHSNLSDVTVTTDPVELQVQPLPQPAPAGFSGAVGDFTLESKIVPQDPKAGEPVTWTLTLKGTGNWGDVQLPARAIPSDLRALQPQQHRDFNGNDLFTGSMSEDLVLIPNRAGELHLDPVRFVYFNPQTQRYETANVQPPVLTVAPGAVPLQQYANAPQAVPVASTAPPATELPHDPLSGTGRAWAPLNGRWVVVSSLLPFVVLAVYWVGVALRRARMTDPRRLQHEALAQLRAAVASVRGAADAAQRKAALLAWQHATAVILGLRVATPTAAHVRAARVEGWPSDSLDEWFELWVESERALYGRDATLAEWWYDQANTVRARLRLARFNPLQALLPRNLLPLTAAVGLLIVCAVAARAEPLAEYRQGNFTVAQQQFAVQASAAPSDWVARYNLGLAAAQLGEEGRAFGETAAAFVFHPRSEAVRWNLHIFAARLPGVDATLAHVAFASGVAAIARAAAPAIWQAVLIAACVALCMGCALTLHDRYQGRASSTRSRAVRALMGVGAIGALSAFLALQQYGSLADPTAAVVARATVLRSVPTEAETTQQPTPLAAGSVVLMQKDFLGWVRIARAHGETGWLRSGDLVPLYGASVTA